MQNNKNTRNILIQSFSGGLDSSTTIHTAALSNNFDDIYPVNFKYGQKNIVETISKNEMLEWLQSKHSCIHKIIDIDVEHIYNNIDNILNFTYSELRDSNKIKDNTNTEFYTPMRNLLFSTLAAIVGEMIIYNKEDVKNTDINLYIGLGVHKHTDVYEKDYWDITSSFVEALDKLFQLNDNINIHMYAPFKDSYKRDIIKSALENNLPYSLTWTCYNPSIKEKVAIPCLECESCRERERGFQELGITDGNNYHVIIEGD